MPMGGSNNRLFFFTQDAAAGEVGTYLVMYVWNFETDELYRYGWTEEIDGKPPHFFYGLEPTTENMAEIESALTALADSAQGCRLATGVTNISIESPPDNDLTEENSLYFFTTRPKILKLTLTLYDAKAVAQMQNTGANATAIESKIAESARQFSKIIFLP